MNQDKNEKKSLGWVQHNIIWFPSKLRVDKIKNEDIHGVLKCREDTNKNMNKHGEFPCKCKQPGKKFLEYNNSLTKSIQL